MEDRLAQAYDEGYEAGQKILNKKQATLTTELADALEKAVGALQMYQGAYRSELGEQYIKQGKAALAKIGR